MSLHKHKMNYLELKYKYNTTVLKPHQALEELRPYGFERGRDIGRILYTERLKSLHVEDVAESINSFKKSVELKEPQEKNLSLYQKMQIKYPTLGLAQMSWELGLENRETKALLDMGILESVSIGAMVSFLENFNYYNKKLTKRKYLKLMYWEYKLTPKEISNMVGESVNRVQTLIQQFDLGKKKNGIQLKGRLGYVMPLEEREKHRNQPHRVAVVQICPNRLEVIREYRSIASTEDGGVFVRDNVRRAIKTLGMHKGYFWAYHGKEKEAIEIIQSRGDLEKRLRKMKYQRPSKENIQEYYIDKNWTLEKCAKKFGCDKGTIAQLAKRYGLRKLTGKITEQELKSMLNRGLKAKEIAEATGYSVTSIYTYISNYGIRRGDNPNE